MKTIWEHHAMAHRELMAAMKTGVSHAVALGAKPRGHCGQQAGDDTEDQPA